MTIPSPASHTSQVLWIRGRTQPSLGPGLPTLLTHGKFDTMRPPVIRAMANAIPNCQVVELPHSGHCSMIDDPGLMNDQVHDFLQCVEEGRCTEPPRLRRAPAAWQGGAYSGWGVDGAVLAWAAVAAAIFAGGVGVGMALAEPRLRGGGGGWGGATGLTTVL